ncbi:MAG: hypothetical protein M3Y86_03905 [Verrucomicrobiota bacterium]|nr:hypothetical protein [Verrucomicrobiota bacterium]
MELFAFAIPALYSLLVLGCCVFLLVRGVTHLFVALFICGAFLHLIEMLGYLYLRRAPGGFSANAHWFPFLAILRRNRDRLPRGRVHRTHHLSPSPHARGLIRFA